MSRDKTPLLVVDDLVVEYRTRSAAVQAVSGVDLMVRRGETVGIVGESGCGKSTLARAVMQLPAPASGRVVFDGNDLTAMSRRQLRRIRPKFQMVFQDPVASLNPRRTVRQIVAEPLTIWHRGSKPERAERVDSVLAAVGIDPAVLGSRRPTELSGGQCQRVAIARAIVAGAELLVCDEAVSSLDVSLRATVLNLLEDLRDSQGISSLFIAHDLAVVKIVSDRVLVMYLGKIVESAPAETLYEHPAHPYTLNLLRSVPVPDPNAPRPQMTLVGDPPSPTNPPSGCRFRTRCTMAQDICARVEPRLESIGDDHLVACHFPLATKSGRARATDGGAKWGRSTRSTMEVA